MSIVRSLFRAVAALVALSVAVSLPAQTATSTHSDAVAAAVRQAAADLPAGGFVLAEVNRDKATYSAAGRPSPRTDLPPEKIIFEIGSITKVFTSLLLAGAVNHGQAALTDPIRKFLPAEVALSPEVAAITLEQLATHTSGLPSLPTNFTPADVADPYADYTVARLYDFLHNFHLEKPAPQPATYSNLGVGLLGHILERIHGQSYAQLVAKKITGPLGMRDTVIELDAEQQARFATPYSGGVAVKPWRLDALAGAGALRSTAADLARFAQALLDKSNPALTAAWELVRKPRAPFGARTSRIGLGILMASRNGETIYNHSGGTGGFRTYLELVPESGRATVLLLNNDTIEPALIVANAQRRAAPAEAKAPPERAETPIDATRLRDYVGVYAIDPRGSFTVVLDETPHLQIRLTGQGFSPVFHAGSDRFFSRVVAAEFQFTRDASGKIASLTLHQNGNTIEARRTPSAPPNLVFLGAEQLKAYVGSYELSATAVFDITARGTTLLAKLTGQAALPVFCDRPDHFVYDGVAAALTFERDDTGAVRALVLHQNGLNQRAPRRIAPANTKSP